MDGQDTSTFYAVNRTLLTNVLQATEYVKGSLARSVCAYHFWWLFFIFYLDVW